MASWQARTFNFVSKRTIKPMLRYGSMSFLKKVMAVLDTQSAAETKLPNNMNCASADAPNYAGEWVTLAESDTKKVVLSLPGGGVYFAG